MAIAFDASTEGSYFGTDHTVLTFSHTCSGSDRIVIVGFSCRSGTISGVTYDGVAMTEINSLNAGGIYFDNTKLFYLINPPTGAKNVVCTTSANGYLLATAVSYTGVDQTNPLDGSNTTVSASASSISCAITTTKDNAWLTGICILNPSATISAGSNTTIRNNTTNWIANFDTNAAQTPAGSKSLAVTRSDTNKFSMAIVALIPVQASTATDKFFQLF